MTEYENGVGHNENLGIPNVPIIGIDHLAELIDERYNNFLVIFLDGIAGGGKSTFADRLAREVVPEILHVEPPEDPKDVILGVDYFQYPRKSYERRLPTHLSWFQIIGPDGLYGALSDTGKAISKREPSIHFSNLYHRSDGLRGHEHTLDLSKSFFICEGMYFVRHAAEQILIDRGFKPILILLKGPGESTILKRIHKRAIEYGLDPVKVQYEYTNIVKPSYEKRKDPFGRRYNLVVVEEPHYIQIRKATVSDSQ